MNRDECMHLAPTLGTAAWKVNPTAGLFPDTLNRARIITMPGFARFVCGVSVIVSSFLSYAIYCVSRGVVGCGRGVSACGNDNVEGSELV